MPQQGTFLQLIDWGFSDNYGGTEVRSFLWSIYTAGNNTFKLIVFRGGEGGWHFKKHITQFVFGIADLLVTLKNISACWVSAMFIEKTTYPAGIYMFNFIVIKKNTITKRKIRSKLTIKVPVVVDRQQLMSLWCFLLTLNIFHIFLLVFLLLTLSMKLPYSNDIKRFPLGIYRPKETY